MCKNQWNRVHSCSSYRLACNVTVSLYWFFRYNVASRYNLNGNERWSIRTRKCPWERGLIPFDRSSASWPPSRYWHHGSTCLTSSHGNASPSLISGRSNPKQTPTRHHAHAQPQGRSDVILSLLPRQWLPGAIQGNVWRVVETGGRGSTVLRRYCWLLQGLVRIKGHPG